MQKTIRRWIHFFEGYARRWWYAPLLAIFAFLDAFIIVIPTDALLVSGSMLAPRRWIYATVMVSLGSALGAGGLAYLLESRGLPWLLHWQPGIEHTHAWVYADQLVDHYGIWGVFAISLTPIMQQPVVAIAAFAGLPVAEITAASFVGRLVKYGLLAYLGTHAPGVLNRLWGFRGELEEAGVVPPHEEKPKHH